MTAALLEALTRLQNVFPCAAALIPIPDTTGPAPGSKPGSRPPWNPAAATAFYDPFEGIIRLHIMFHAEVTGRPPAHIPRGGHATGTHLRAIRALAVNVSPGTAQEATRMVNTWVTRINQLPARDVDERWQRVQGAACYHCQVPMLRLAPRAGRVTCVRSGACFDCEGRHPVGFVRHDGLEPVVEWADGCLQYATVTAT